MITGTTWLPLAEVADVFVGVATRTPRPPCNAPISRVLTVRALGDTGIDGDAVSELECLGHVDEGQTIRAGDILVAARSTRVVCALVARELEGIPINATLLGIRCLPSVQPRLLLAYLQHPDGQAAIEGLAQSGTAQMNLTVRVLKKLSVPVPPLAEQQRLVELLNAADDAYTAAMEAADVRRGIAESVVFSKLTRR